MQGAMLGVDGEVPGIEVEIVAMQPGELTPPAAGPCSSNDQQPGDVSAQRAGLVRGSREGRENVWQLEPRRLAEARGYLDLISREWDGALERLRILVEE